MRGALIEANLPLVRYAAARFRSRNEPMEDVVQVGTIGLINAIDRFDPERGVQFPTFAMPTVVGEIKRYFRDNVRTVHVPRRLHELWVQVTGATEDLTTRLRALAHDRRDRRAAADHRGRGPGLHRGRTLVPRNVAGGRPGGRRPARSARPARLRGPGARRRRAPRPRPPSPRPTARARTADPAAALLQQSDAVTDQRRTRRLPDACVKTAGQELRAAAIRKSDRGVTGSSGPRLAAVARHFSA